MSPILVGIAYAVCAPITFGGLLAYIQNYHDDEKFNNENFRTDAGFASLMSLIPVAWVIAPFLTGFYEHGFQFRRKR